MARYFFDTDDGHLTRDHDGLECATTDEVRHAAIEALPSIAQEAISDADCKSFSVLVRNDTGRPIFHATLTLAAKWLD